MIDQGLRGENGKPTRVISLRLPSAVDRALLRSAADSGRSASSGLDWLLLNSFGNCQLLGQLEDCPDVWDAKLDARIRTSTFEQLKFATEQLGGASFCLRSQALVSLLHDQEP